MLVFLNNFPLQTFTPLSTYRFHNSGVSPLNVYKLSVTVYSLKLKTCIFEVMSPPSSSSNKTKNHLRTSQKQLVTLKNRFNLLISLNKLKLRQKANKIKPKQLKGITPFWVWTSVDMSVHTSAHLFMCVF